MNEYKAENPTKEKRWEEIEDKLMFLLNKSNQLQEIIANLTNRIQELERISNQPEDQDRPSIQPTQHKPKPKNFLPAIPIDMDGNTLLQEKSTQSRSHLTGSR